VEHVPLDQFDLFQRFAVALAIGVLIGVERGWEERSVREGSRVAGIRTFAITSLLGGLWMLLAEDIGPILLGFAFAAYAGIMMAARIRAAVATGDLGATTVVAAMVTFALGALAVAGELAISAACGVVTALLLGIKAPLHDWLQRIDRDELLAVLKLLAMSLVLLPVLPDKGYGPWQVLNPYEMWLMVVLVAGISLLGYLAIKLAGARVGIPLAGLLAGLASSTAATLTFSRFAKLSRSRAGWHGLGIVVAATTMFPRMAILTSIIAPETFRLLFWPFAGATLAGGAGALILWLRLRASETDDRTREPDVQNPFEFFAALRFGLLLAAILFLTRALLDIMGDRGVYLMAVVAGFADVDAITLSLGRMSLGDIGPELAAAGIVIAGVSNTSVKIAMSLAIAGRRLLWPVALPLGASGAAAAVLWWLI
jgi:uncharacterized membrane protein (DUF4010 family)